MSARKKWATSFPRVAAWKRRHDSKAAAYRYAVQQRDQWKAQMLRSPHLTVWVDEGAGWQQHERIDLDVWGDES